MTRILIVIALVLAAGVVHGQQNCAQTLRLASSSYDQGRLHELPGLLKGCLQNANGFTKQERVTAYKLLTLSYIYLEEPQKADSAMINLLRDDHFFEPNQAIDPAEFIGLYNTFRNKPIFSVGLKLGGNMTLPSVSSNYYVAQQAAGAGSYGNSISLIQVGLAFEKALFQRWKNPIWRRFTFAPEIFVIMPRKFQYNSIQFVNAITPSDPASQTDLTVTENQNWIDLNALVQFRLKPKSKFDPYVALGPGISYLTSSEATTILKRGTTGNVVTGKAVDLTSRYNKIIYSASVSVGGKYKIGELYATAEVRYQYGLTNLMNSAARYNNEFALDYTGPNNDYTISNISFMVGVNYPVFNPQKLKKNKRK